MGVGTECIYVPIFILYIHSPHGNLKRNGLHVPKQCEHHLSCVISSCAGLSKVLQVGSGGDANGVLSSKKLNK